MGNVDSVNLTSSINENNTDNTRQLVVISVRGSVTPLDWLMDILTQFHIKASDFETGRDNVPEF